MTADIAQTVAITSPKTRLFRYKLLPHGHVSQPDAAVHREEDWYVAQCLEVDVASQGHTIDEPLSNLAEAVALYLDEHLSSWLRLAPFPGSGRCADHGDGGKGDAGAIACAMLRS